MAGLQEAFDRIGAALEHHLESSHAAGAALAITDREEILGVAVRGLADVAAGTPVRPETRFQIGSISKSFAGIVALQEAEAGTLDLHVSVNEILPWLELPEPFGPITLHHLMQHTAGLAIGTEAAPTLAGALWLLRGLPPTTAPGERFWYSNDGWKIVGACLEQVTGTPIHELLAERLFGPLGMRDSVGPHRRRGIRAHGGRLRAHALGPSAAAAAHLVGGAPHRLEHGRRLDRLDRDRHGRLRAPAAGARRRARWARGSHRLGTRGSRCLPTTGVDDGDGGAVRVRPLAGGRRRPPLDRALAAAWSGTRRCWLSRPTTASVLVVLQNGGGGEARGRDAMRLAAVRTSLAGGDAPRGLGSAGADPRSPRPRTTSVATRATTGAILEVEAVDGRARHHDRARSRCGWNATRWPVRLATCSSSRTRHSIGSRSSSLATTTGGSSRLPRADVVPRRGLHRSGTGRASRGVRWVPGLLPERRSVGARDPHPRPQGWARAAVAVRGR